MAVESTTEPTNPYRSTVDVAVNPDVVEDAVDALEQRAEVSDIDVHDHGCIRVHSHHHEANLQVASEQITATFRGQLRYHEIEPNDIRLIMTEPDNSEGEEENDLHPQISCNDGSTETDDAQTPGGGA